MSTRIGIGLLGFGTVGSGVFELLREKSRIHAKHNFEFEVRKVLVRDPSKKRASSLPKQLIAKNVEEILSDPTIDVVVEVMGGDDPTKEYIIKAFKAGKNVITANKRLMGSCGDMLVKQARSHELFFGYAASVTGCHQLCASVVNSVMVTSIVGIFNGTANYILTQMEDGLSLDAALKEAQARGYAEADPSEDIDGLDTCKKLVIMSQLAFGEFLNYKDIPTQGIREVTLRDMEIAKELGYTIKLLGVCKRHEDDRIEARVHPAAVPKNGILGSVRGACNGILVHDLLRGRQGMTAEGAGSRPTAMAIFQDLVSLARKEKIIWPVSPDPSQSAKRIRKGSSVCKYLVHCNVDDHPGVLAAITKTFARYEINIQKVLQREAGSTANLAMICGPSEERLFNKALAEIDSLGVVQRQLNTIVVEEPEPSQSPNITVKAAQGESKLMATVS